VDEATQQAPTEGPAAQDATPAPPSAGASEAKAARSSRPATVEIVVVPYGEIAIDGSPAGSSPLTVRLAPGEHVITAKTPDGKSERRVVLAAGERKQVVMR
jgi:serine/threonine-protein kinase